MKLWLPENHMKKEFQRGREWLIILNTLDRKSAILNNLEVMGTLRGTTGVKPKGWCLTRLGSMERVEAELEGLLMDMPLKKLLKGKEKNGAVAERTVIKTRSEQ